MEMGSGLDSAGLRTEKDLQPMELLSRMEMVDSRQVAALSIQRGARDSRQMELLPSRTDLHQVALLIRTEPRH
jgi:hypothetical protein